MANLSESVSARQRQQVLMEFFENSVNLTVDFHTRVEYLVTGEKPPSEEPGLEDTCGVI
ncbi:uncharacterized protein LOC117171989 isoform X2 [Belonocnema kinseyi]|uniref:uncharacterized protein LOC117171989 isoform X2 n=1 Tax=Belonocnema kinseyi TaxID=2817044 RepID=UPI00143DC102|nr:uncharacterized protein LOC117171989 isoform X2 [Belonocnema kinseyi]